MFDLKSILDALNTAQAADAAPVPSQFPPDIERNLCAGALLVLNSCCEPRSLSLGVGSQAVADSLQSAWDIAGADDLRETIEALLSGGQHLGMDPALKAIHAKALDGESDSGIHDWLVEAFGEDDANDLRDAVGSLVESVGAQGAPLTNMRDIHAAIDTVRAWDIERAAFNARMGFEAGYIEEDEALAILARCRSLAESTYDSWRAYGIAFVLGRVIGYSADCDFIISELGEQLESEHSLYACYSLRG